MKMYRTTTWKGNEILEKDFINVSHRSVFWIDDDGKKKREPISTYYHIWHASKEDAINWLKNKWNKQIADALKILEDAKNKLSELG